MRISGTKGVSYNKLLQEERVSVSRSARPKYQDLMETKYCTYRRFVLHLRHKAILWKFNSSIYLRGKFYHVLT